MMEFVNGKDDIPYMKWKIKSRTRYDQNLNKKKRVGSNLPVTSNQLGFLHDLHVQPQADHHQLGSLGEAQGLAVIAIIMTKHNDG